MAASQLNLRAEPGTWAPVIGQLWQGERLALLAGPTPDDWYQVQAGDQTGWAFGGLLVDGAGDASARGHRGRRTAGSAGRRRPHVQTVTLYEGDVPVASYWAAMGSDPSDDGFFATAVGPHSVYEKFGAELVRLGGAWAGDWVVFDPARLDGLRAC